MLLREQSCFLFFFISAAAPRVLLEWRMRTFAVVRILRFLRGRSELQREAEADQCPEHCWRVTVELLLLRTARFHLDTHVAMLWNDFEARHADVLISRSGCA